MTPRVEAGPPTIVRMFPLWQSARISLKGYKRLYSFESRFETWVEKA
jgi:hypothetical protein